jgi:hypothetical protein
MYKKGKHPVFTSKCILGNLDFEKIKGPAYQNYFFQPLHETINEYLESKQIFRL